MSLLKKIGVTATLIGATAATSIFGVNSQQPQQKPTIVTQAPKNEQKDEKQSLNQILFTPFGPSKIKGMDQSDIYIINTDGSGLKNLTNTQEGLES